MGENTGGKGSKPRPIPDRKSFEDNWDRIFGTSDPEKQKEQPNENSK